MGSLLNSQKQKNPPQKRRVLEVGKSISTSQLFIHDRPLGRMHTGVLSRSWISSLFLLSLTRNSTRYYQPRCSAINQRFSYSLINYALAFDSSVLSPTKPFRDDQPVAQPAREASTSDSYILWYYPLTERQFSSSSLMPLSR